MNAKQPLRRVDAYVPFPTAGGERLASPGVTEAGVAVWCGVRTEALVVEAATSTHPYA